MNFELAWRLVAAIDDETEIDATTQDTGPFDTQEFDAIIHSDGIFWPDWKESPDGFVEMAREAIGIKGLYVEGDGQIDYVVFGDRRTRIPPQEGYPDQEMILRILNETLAPEYEIRMLWYALNNESQMYMPLNAASWLALEKEFGEKRVAKAFIKLKFDASAAKSRKPVETQPIIHKVKRDRDPNRVRFDIPIE